MRTFPNLKMRRKTDMDFLQFYGKELYDLEYRNAQPNLQAVVDGMKKYDKPKYEIDSAILDQARDWTIRHWMPYLTTHPFSTIEEAMEGMDMSTSPGYPYNKDYSTKQDYLDAKGTGEIREFIDNFSKAPSPRFYWQSSLKEEIRTLKKLKEGKIRQFSGSPITATVLGRILFRKQNEDFYKSFLCTFSAVGISITGGGWNRLHAKLSKFAEGWNLDYKEYDSSILAQILYTIRDIRLESMRKLLNKEEYDWMEDHVNKYYDEIVESVYILPTGDVIKKFLGNPSGGINTVVDNTLGLFIILVCTFIKQFPEENYQYFMENVTAALYGDDNTLTVSPDIIDVFNATAIHDFSKTIGMVVKDKDLQKKPVKELHFLSFGFREFGRWVIPKYMKPRKLIASLGFRDARTGPVNKLQKALALRELLVGHDLHFTKVTNYINFLNKKYHSVVEFTKMMRCFKTRMEIIRTFLPFEGGTLPLKDAA